MHTFVPRLFRSLPRQGLGKWTAASLLSAGMLPCCFALQPALQPAQAAGGAAPVAAQELKSLSLEQLGNIEVTTQSKEPTQVWDTPAAIFVLTQDDIRRSGVTSVADALRLVPGVNVERVNGSRNWAVGIRGLGDQFSKYVQVLIDGRSVYTPLFGGVLWTVNNVMLEDIDRIEVIRGPGGTIWGPNAVNGIINIITRSAAETKGVLATAGGGSTDRATAGLRYGTSSAGVHYRFYAMGFDRGPEYHQGTQPNYDWSRDGQVGARADWKRGRNEFTLQGDAYLGHFGDAQTISTFTPPTVSVSYAPTNADGGNILGRWRRDLADQGGDLYLQAYWMHDRRLGSNFGEVRDTLDIDFLHRTKQTRYQQFTYGAGLRVSPSTLRQVVPTDFFTPAQKADSIYSAFLQEEVRPIPGKLAFTAGIKLEHNSYTGFDDQPNGRVLFTPNAHTTLWASVSRAVRIPDRVDDDINVAVLAATTPAPIYVRLIGNTNLRAERLLAYEAGYRALVKPKLYVDLAWFHNSYHDIVAQGPATLVSAPIPPYPPSSLLVQFQYTNGIRATTEGFELGPAWDAAHWARFRATYSYLHVDMADQTGFTDTLTLTSLHGSSPNSVASVRGLFDLPHHFELDETVRYVGPLPAQQVKAYVTADVHAAYHMAHGLDVSIVGQNLFQPHHAEFGIDPGPEVLIRRGVYAKLVWTK